MLSTPDRVGPGAPLANGVGPCDDEAEEARGRLRAPGAQAADPRGGGTRPGQGDAIMRCGMLALFECRPGRKPRLRTGGRRPAEDRPGNRDAAHRVPDGFAPVLVPRRARPADRLQHRVVPAHRPVARARAAAAGAGHPMGRGRHPHALRDDHERLRRHGVRIDHGLVVTHEDGRLLQPDLRREHRCHDQGRYRPVPVRRPGRQEDRDHSGLDQRTSHPRSAHAAQARCGTGRVPRPRGGRRRPGARRGGRLCNRQAGAARDWRRRRTCAT